MTQPGKVFLVGAGPGDPDLITVAGLRALRRADVVLFDRLVAAELLAEAPRHAERIYVGKEPRGRCVGQDETNALLVEHARAGRTVVRLKGGDPFVFGRGAEEALACTEAGIPWEVIPGISSVLGVTARALVPVTFRGEAGAFAVVTGHRAPGVEQPDWAALSRIETLVILMGLSQLAYIADELVAVGRAPDTPVAIIERGTLPDERVTTGTLADIAGLAMAAAVRPPAVIVVGEVVRLRDVLGGVLRKEAGAAAP